MIQDVSEDIIELCARTVKDNEDEKRHPIDADQTLTNAQKSRAVLQSLFKYLDPLNDDEQ